MPSPEETDPLVRELSREDGATYVVKAVAAGEALRDYGDAGGGVGDVVLGLVEIVSMGLRRFIRPGWTVGVFLWRRRRLPRLVYKERLSPTDDPARSVELLARRLSEGWRPKGL